MVYDNGLLAGKIKMCRTSKNITQEKLAEFCGVSRQAVAKWEAGKSIPDVIALRELALLFNVRVDYLLDLEDNPSGEQDNEALNYMIVNNALREAMAYQNPTKMINIFLEFLGKNLCADRCYIFEKNTTEQCMTNTYEWCANGVEPQIKNLQAIPCEELEAWFEYFRKQGNVVIYNIEDIKVSEPEIYKWLKPQKIRSLLVLPIFGNRCFFGVDNPPISSIQKINSILEIVTHFLECFLKYRDTYLELQLDDEKLKHWDKYLGVVRYTYDLKKGSLEFVGDAKEILVDLYELKINTYDSLVKCLNFHPECKEIILKSGVEAVLTKKENVAVNLPFLSERLGLKWYKLTLCPLLDDDNNVMQIFGAIKDISEEQLVLERNKAISTYVPGGIHICYLSEPIHLLYASDSLCTMAGYTKEEFERLVGDNYTNIVIDEDKDKFEEYALKASQTIGSISCRYRIRTKQGKIVSVLDTMQVKKEQDGIIYGYANVIDVTELEKGIEKSKAKQKAIERTLSIDRLTGVGNARALKNRLKKLEAEADIGILVCKLNSLDDEKLGINVNIENSSIMELKDIICCHFSEDSVFRLGADELLVLIAGANPARLAHRMEVFTNSQEIKNLASVGYCLGKFADYKELFGEAEAIMYNNFNKYLESYFGQ